MANPKKNTIHHQMIMRRSSRSEFKDGLLRNNQRHENRLLLELDQWEKAQRTVAKGLDKESHYFKQSATSSGYNPQRTSKRNSLAEVTDNGQPRFIPDYQYRNRSTIAAQPSGGGETERSNHRAAESPENSSAEKKSSDQEPSPRSHKKHGKGSEGEGKKSSSKHGDHRRSSHSHKKSRHRGDDESRDRAEKEKSDSAQAGRDSGVVSEKKASKPAPAAALGAAAATAAAEASTPSVKQNPSATSGKSTPPKPSSTKPSKKPAAPAVDSTTLLSAVNASINTIPIPTTDTTDGATPTPDGTKPEASSRTTSGARSFSICEDVHDPGDVIVSSKGMREMGWDGRRRYTNVWDSLSAPKRTSQVRSVRSRLQREFTQPPPSTDGSSRGLAVRSARTPSFS